MDELYLESKKIFSKNISNMCNFALCFFFFFFYLINLICASISIIIFLNKFSKYNRVNVSSFEIKYLDLYPSLDFLSFIFRYH